MNLAHYDPNAKIIVAADACEYGVGAVLLHEYSDGTQKAVYHASKSLTPAQRKYSQIEKEALALVFAVRKFHKFLFGRRFQLLTDHKPLLAIFGSKKGIPVYSANRLMRWATILLGYNFELKHVSTSKFGQADALSRLMQDFPTENEDVVIASVELDVNYGFDNTIRQLPVTDEDVRTETSRDPILRRVRKFVKESKWPDGCDKEMKPFRNRASRLSVVQDCILDGDRVVVPSTLRKAVLKELHTGHPGILRMKGLARSLVYWPGMDKDCENFVQSCEICALNSKSPTKVPLHTWPTPEHPWQRIHVDFAGPIDTVYYFIIVDAYSKWPEVIPMKTISSKATVDALIEQFAKFGIPECIVSDNGTQFTSAYFKNMCELNGIAHMRTAPYHPQSNGQAERFVDTFKRGFAKLKGEGRATANALQVLLQSYRSTPSGILNGKSPAELFLGRKVRTRLSLIQPSAHHGSDCRKKLREQMENQFNKKHGTKCRQFAVGDSVLVKWHQQNSWIWKRGVLSRKIGNVMWEVKIDGRLYNRHENQLRACADMSNDNENEKKWLDTMLFTYNLGYQDMPPMSGHKSSVVRFSEQNVANRDMTQSGSSPTETEKTEPVLRRSTRISRPPDRYKP